MRQSLKAGSASDRWFWIGVVVVLLAVFIGAGRDVYLRTGGRSLRARTPAYPPSSLCEAVYAGDIVAVRMFLDKGEDVNGRDPTGVTPLGAAVWGFYDRHGEGGNLSIVRMLLESGADVNIKDAHGLTPLYMGTGVQSEGGRELEAMLRAYAARPKS
jgi:hypothetical protein